jgi:hypothetical protein
MAGPRVALISNPKSTGNLAQLPRIRAFCAERPDIFHYEVEKVGQIGDAMKSIARIKPSMLIINGGDGTVQATLTELHNGGHFEMGAPPVAVLPNGKTNLIALDLGAQGDPVAALERLIEFAKEDLAPHIVARELIALQRIDGQTRPVIGMFLGGAGLADIMLYCRHKIYPLGLPNGFSHLLTAIAVVVQKLFGIRASFLPPQPRPLSIVVRRAGKIDGRFSLLLVTTLDKLLLSGGLHTSGMTERGTGPLKLLAIDERPFSLLRALVASLGGKLGRRPLRGVHVEGADEITIEGAHSSVILDGEMFEADIGHPIVLRPAPPLSFVRLAA